MEWLRHARVFIVDGYYYPLKPEIEYDAEKLAVAMAQSCKCFTDRYFRF